MRKAEIRRQRRHEERQKTQRTNAKSKHTKRQKANSRTTERKEGRTKEKGTHTARCSFTTAPDSSNAVSKRPAPNPNFLFGRGVGFSLSGCRPTCSKSWRLGSQRGLCRSTRETRLRKEVEGKQFEGKQLEGNKFESMKKAPDVHSPFLAWGI